MKHDLLFNSGRGLLTRLTLLLTLILGGATSAWADGQSLPYNYGFEDNNLATDGWTMVDYYNGGSAYNTTGIYTSSSYPARTDSYLFRFYSGSTTSADQYLITPLIENSPTGVDFSFYYNIFAINSQTRTFSVGYSTTDTNPSSFGFTDYSVSKSDKSWYQITTSFPTGTKYIAIKYTSKNCHLYIDDITIEAQETYKKPKDLTLDSYTANSITLSWTNGRDESAWQIAYSTKEDFDPDTEGVKVSVTDNPYTISGLTDGVTYYAYVRSNYSGNYSVWSENKLKFTPCIELTINDGNSTSLYAPIYGYKVNYDFKSQIIIPKASLEDLKGRNITQLTFYASQSSVSWGNARFDVYLNEVENTTYASTPVFESWGTKVCSEANLSISDNKMVIVFDTPYLYSGGNLMIGFESTATGTSATSSWYGVSGSYNEAYYYYGTSYTTTRTGHFPKVTFRTFSTTVPATIGENGFTTFACGRPLDMSVPTLSKLGLKAYKAAIYMDEGKVRFTEINQTVPANTGMLLAGSGGETYNIPVVVEGTTVSDNAFMVNTAGGTFDGSGYTYYAMKKAKVSSDPLVFSSFDPSARAIPTDKAYFKVENNSVKGLTFEFDEETGIEGVENEKLREGEKENAIFNLAGQRVSKAQKGLYIVNGRKLMVK